MATRRHPSLPFDIVAVVVTAAIAVPCALAAQPRGSGRVISLVRRLQSGSVNDYAGYLVAGMVATVVVLAR